MLGMARSVFYYANEGMDAGIKYKQPLRSPTGKQLRKARHETGERLFEAVEIQELLDVASDSMKAMILLGINCGFGNYDCATLPIEASGFVRWVAQLLVLAHRRFDKFVHERAERGPGLQLPVDSS